MRAVLRIHDHGERYTKSRPAKEEPEVFSTVSTCPCDTLPPPPLLAVVDPTSKVRPGAARKNGNTDTLWQGAALIWF